MNTLQSPHRFALGIPIASSSLWMQPKGRCSTGWRTRFREMIKGVHTMFYSSKAEELRAFLRDKLDLPYTDVGEGWLIFDVPEAEMGCHPADAADGSPSGTHNISFYCDDLSKTVSELKARGVEFVGEIADHGYGLVTHFKMPGEVEVQLYQPRYRKQQK